MGCPKPLMSGFLHTALSCRPKRPAKPKHEYVEMRRRNDRHSGQAEESCICNAKACVQFSQSLRLLPGKQKRH